MKLISSAEPLRVECGSTWCAKRREIRRAHQGQGQGWAAVADARRLEHFGVRPALTVDQLAKDAERVLQLQRPLARELPRAKHRLIWARRGSRVAAQVSALQCSRRGPCSSVSPSPEPRLRGVWRGADPPHHHHACTHPTPERLQTAPAAPSRWPCGSRTRSRPPGCCARAAATGTGGRGKRAVWHAQQQSSSRAAAEQ
jgi:hypothetical protein